MRDKYYNRDTTVRELRGMVAILLVLLMGMAAVIAILSIQQGEAEAAEPEALPPTLCAVDMLQRPAGAGVLPDMQPVETQPAEEPAAADAGTPADTYFRADIALGVEEQRLLHDAAEEFGVPYLLALAVVQQETHYQNLIGDNGASFGYMQVQPRWWQDKMDALGVRDLMDPAGNFRVGCSILADLLAEKDTEKDAIAAYNGKGERAEAYAAAVLAILAELEAGT